MPRKLFFFYGLACHALFLGVYGWMAAFVGNLSFGLLPTIDGSRDGSLATALAVNALLVAAFGVQHSVMARPRFKQWWARFVPQPIERSTYVLFSCVLMMLLMWQWRPLGGVVWEVTNPAAKWTLHVLFALGWLGVPLVSLFINHFDLFGTRQVWLHLRGRSYEHLPFRTPLAYRVVRHPLYVGWMVAFWATPTMTAAHLLFAVLMTAYILIAIPLEERDLVAHFGQKYVEYRRRVGGLVPRLPSWGEPKLDFGTVRDVTWWSWVVMIALLVVHFATGRTDAIVAAATICAAMAIIDLIIRRGDIEALSVQIRLFYALLLVLGLLPGMGWVHTMQLVGTSIRVSIGYCMLERELRLMPWNLIERLTLRTAWQIVTARPSGGFVRFGDEEIDRSARSACAIGRYEPQPEPALAP
jgi:protein-S-isoprenylcysteine O-methyltransferase Ste14